MRGRFIGDVHLYALWVRLMNAKTRMQAGELSQRARFFSVLGAIARRRVEIVEDAKLLERLDRETEPMRLDFESDIPTCEACDNTGDDCFICEGCACCQECCNCTDTDCDCEGCQDRREER